MTTKSKPQEQGKHTPGPWMVLDQPHADTFSFFVGAEGRAIASVFSHPGQKPKEAAFAQESADARLIAAAPDTYGVCDLIMLTEAYNAANRDYPTVEQWNEIVKAARAAIAKASNG